VLVHDVSFLGKIFGRKSWEAYEPDLDELPDLGA